MNIALGTARCHAVRPSVPFAALRVTTGPTARVRRARSELEGSSQPTIEAVVGRRLLGVTASDFEASKALVPKAAARLH